MSKKKSSVFERIIEAMENQTEQTRNLVEAANHLAGELSVHNKEMKDFFQHLEKEGIRWRTK